MYPATKQTPPTMHDKSSSARNEAGRSPSCCHVCPKFVLWAVDNSVPSFSTTMQSAGLAHETLVMVSAPAGAVAVVQVAPASLVVTTTPLPGKEAPLEPTAMQSVTVGQETPLSSGVLPPETCSAFQEMPPFFVAAMTVAPPGGGEMSGPATPTAQHRFALAHDTAPRSPVPAGAG